MGDNSLSEISTEMIEKFDKGFKQIEAEYKQLYEKYYVDKEIDTQEYVSKLIEHVDQSIRHNENMLMLHNRLDINSLDRIKDMSNPLLKKIGKSLKFVEDVSTELKNLKIQLQNKSAYFAIPSNAYMLLILPLFTGNTKRIPKRLLTDDFKTEEAKEYINQVVIRKNESFIDVNDRYIDRETTIALVADTPKVYASSEIDTMSLFSENIEEKEHLLAMYLRTTFGSVGIKHFLGYLIALDENQRNGTFVFDVNEHLHRLGYRKKSNGDYDPNLKKEAYDILKVLTNLTITIESKTRKNRTIVREKFFNLDADYHTLKNNKIDSLYRVRASDSWYKNSMFTMDGQLPQYTRLLKAIAQESAKDHSYTLYLAPLFAVYWRINGSMTWSLKSLLEWCNINIDKEHNKSRLLKNIESELQFMQIQGYLGNWKTKSGKDLSYHRLNDIIELTPPDYLGSKLGQIDSKKNSNTKSVINKEQLKSICKESGLTQKQIASALGISPSALSKIVNGQRGISREINYRVSEAFQSILKN
jgi:DNA-binding XRE family transcriptional regulator